MRTETSRPVKVTSSKTNNKSNKSKKVINKRKGEIKGREGTEAQLSDTVTLRRAHIENWSKISVLILGQRQRGRGRGLGPWRGRQRCALRVD